MKKILLATTALTMSAGFAAAEVSVGGSANIGLKYSDSAAQQTVVHHEIDMNVVGSTTTDTGLSFSATIELDTDNNRGSLTDPSGVVSMSGAFGTISVGAVDAGDDNFFGALEVGYDGIGLDDVAEGGYAGGTHDVAYTNTIGAVSVAFSTSESDSNDDLAFGLRYKGPITIAVGYNDNTTTDVQVTSIGLTGSLNGVSYNVALADNSANGNSFGLGVTYGVGNGMSLRAGVANNDADTDASFGLGMTYSLGGGATLAGALGSIDGANVADLGVNFSF